MRPNTRKGKQTHLYHYPWCVGKHVHRVQTIDTEAGTLICVNCGTVPILWQNRTENGVSKRRAICSKTKKHWSEYPSNFNWADPRIGHGLTIAQARAFKEGKVCEICGTSEKLVVDHVHSTGQIRGVLCDQHNRAIGMLGDDLAGVQRAERYLQKAEEGSVAVE